MSHTPVRVAVVDDFELIVNGVRHMLAPYADRVKVVEMNANTEPVSDVDVALFDAFGRHNNTFEQLAHLVQQSRIGAVVVYTWLNETSQPEALLRHGVSGVLSKSLGASELVEAIERIAEGEVIISDPSHRVDEPPAAPSGRDWPGRSAGLTMREAEMIILIAKGYSNAEIAKFCFLSPNSVKSYIRSAYRKIGVTRRSQAVAWGIGHGLTDDHARTVLS